MIERLEIENFKSFRKLDLELGRLNCFIGPNACGKSNLIDALAFLQQCVSDSVTTAFDDRGGYAEVGHKGGAGQQEEARKGRSIGFLLRVALDPLDPPLPLRLGERRPARAHAARLEYAGRLRHFHGQARVVEEQLGGEWRDEEGRTGAAMVFRRTGGSLRFCPGPWSDAWGQRREVVLPPDVEADRLLLGGSFGPPAARELASALEAWGFYDVQPRFVRYALGSEGVELDGSGANLAAVVRRLWRSRSKNARRAREEILDGIRIGMRGPERLETRRERDGGIMLWVRERGVRGPLSARCVSDGTIRLITYHVLAATTEPGPGVVCIEEPDRNLHPHLLEQLRDLLRTLSERTQVIVTTHNPGLVDLLEPNEVFLMDKEGGRTRVMRAQEVEHIEAFRKDFSLGELWAQGAIGGVPE